MSKPVFMSPEHVQQMNTQLGKDIASIGACAALTRKYQISYDLDDEAGGKVWWTMSFVKGEGVRFHLAPPEGGQADITFSGSYWKMLEFMRRAKAGEVSPADMPLQFGGDPDAYGAIMGAFTAAQAAATIDTDIPAQP